MDVDLLVIGSGPGGYHAAIRAAQLGLKVAVAERGDIGGVCLNVGCIPTKALLHAGQVIMEAKDAPHFGVSFGPMNLDLPALNRHRDAVVGRMTNGVSGLFKSNKVEVVRGEARLTSRTSAAVGDQTVNFKRCIVATGSAPANLPGFTVDNKKVVDSTGALVIDEVPARFLAIGAGAIGLEFATVYSRLGSKAKVIEFLDRIAPTADEEVGALLGKAMTKQGMELQPSTKANGFTEEADGLHVELEDVKTGAKRVEIFDRVLVATGRRPNGQNLGLEALGVQVSDRGFITVNDRLETAVPEIMAIGDVIGNPMLAHKAMHEGLVAAERAAGRDSRMEVVTIPGVIYTQPELAWAGLTEAEAKAKGLNVKVGKFPLSASGRAVTLDATDGIAKVVADADTDLVVGVHLLGPGASDLIAEAVLGMEMAATVEDFALTIHPHPTMSEIVLEGMENVHGQSIHIVNRPSRR
ncbi:MAG TPA: dihydrolipoyl dehydrogenase [Deinococcales bacterium]|nr:dihydrolipoyl dehydrogenase [Deinococcales bacterium]